jgi:hypothetical protein
LFASSLRLATRLTVDTLPHLNRAAADPSDDVRALAVPYLFCLKPLLDNWLEVEFLGSSLVSQYSFVCVFFQTLTSISPHSPKIIFLYPSAIYTHVWYGGWNKFLYIKINNLCLIKYNGVVVSHKSNYFKFDQASIKKIYNTKYKHHR